jgi:outer membrane autotransporter protein
MFFEANKPVAWAQVFGGHLDRDTDGNLMAYNYDHLGINFGYEWDINQVRMGLMGGYVKTHLDTQLASFSSESDNYYIGAYANMKVSGMSLTGSLITGYGDIENQRLVLDNINGYVTAESDFDSVFLSPSLTLASAYRIDDRLEIRPSASIAYSIAWLDSYTESGTTNANLHIDDRKAKALTARIQVAAAYELTTQSELEVRLGLNSRHTNDEDTQVSIANSNFKFSSGADEDVTTGFAGTSLRISQANLSLVADIEFGGNNKEDYVAAQLSLEYAF